MFTNSWSRNNRYHSLHKKVIRVFGDTLTYIIKIIVGTSLYNNKYYRTPSIEENLPLFRPVVKFLA